MILESIEDIQNTNLPEPIKQLFIEAFENGARVESDQFTTPIIKHPDFHEDSYLLIGYFGRDVHAWYKYNRNCNRALGTIDPTDTYDNIIKDLIKNANTCPHCNKLLGANKLKSYGFASFACDDCYKDAYDKFRKINGNNWWN